jgi:WhiB family redox-sensing transcriptional regulator
MSTSETSARCTGEEQVAEGPGETDPIATAVREEDATWMAQARCRGMNPSVFFPSDGAGFEVAQRICVECPVRAECLEFALANRIEQGAWGGTSERERRRILRRRRALKLENEFVLARRGHEARSNHQPQEYVDSRADTGRRTGPGVVTGGVFDGEKQAGP